METKTSYFDTWLDNQKRWMDTWQSSYKQMQENLGGTEAFKKSTEALGGWMKSGMDAMQNNAEGAMNNGAQNSNDMFAQWAGMGQNMMKAWQNAGNQFWGGMGQMNQNSQTASNWMNNASQAGKTWMDSMQNWNRLTSDGSKWWNATMDSFKQNQQMMNSLKEAWAPIWNNMKDGQWNAEQWTAAFQPDRVKELTDKIFGFNSESFFNTFGKQATDMMSTWAEKGQHMRDEAMQGMRDSMSQMTKGYSEMRNAYRPFFTMAQPGDDRDMAESAMRNMDLTAQYAAHGGELQYHYYRTAENAWKQLGEMVKAKMEAGEKYSSFNDFYSDWVKVYEQAYLNLFNSDEYTQVQGEMVNLGLDMRSQWEKTIENSIKDFPIVRRSQMDEIYKANYDLRKRVTDLENVIEELRTKSNQQPMAQKTEQPAQATQPTQQGQGAKDSGNSRKGSK